MFGNENSSGMGLTLACVLLTGCIFAMVFNGIVTGNMDLTFAYHLIRLVGL